MVSICVSSLNTNHNVVRDFDSQVSLSYSILFDYALGLTTNYFFLILNQLNTSFIRH
jgi:hypothetical protein